MIFIHLQNFSGLYDFEIASVWKQLGHRFNIKSNPEVRWKLKDALELCDKVINKFPKSRASELCKVLKSQIRSSRLNLSTETVIPIQSYSKFLIKYTNIETLDFKIFKVNASQKEAFDNLYRPDQRLKFLKTKPL